MILAAGGGSRFGGTKQLAELRGRPLLAYAVDAMLAVPAIWPVVVVLGHDAAAVRARVDVLADVEVAVSERWADGMAASLQAGIAALGDVEAAVVTLGDQPFVSGQVIAGVLDHRERYDAVRTTYDGEPGHPVLLTRRLLDRAGELTGDSGFRALLEGQRVRRFEAAHLCDPADVDTQTDLERLRGT